MEGRKELLWWRKLEREREREREKERESWKKGAVIKVKGDQERERMRGSVGEMEGKVGGDNIWRKGGRENKRWIQVRQHMKEVNDDI